MNMQLRELLRSFKQNTKTMKRTKTRTVSTLTTTVAPPSLIELQRCLIARLPSSPSPLCPSRPLCPSLPLRAIALLPFSSQYRFYNLYSPLLLSAALCSPGPSFFWEASFKLLAGLSFSPSLSLFVLFSHPNNLALYSQRSKGKRVFLQDSFAFQRIRQTILISLNLQLHRAAQKPLPSPMERTHGRRDSSFYTEDEEEEKDRDERSSGGSAGEGYRFLPINSCAPSRPAALNPNRADSSDASPSNAPATAQPSSSASAVEMEQMFSKVVTPSDVGKLNRLVIPKQHAEKYFPLDSSAHDKGLLLNFEDRNGKPWRFRYSYWNSSQSYVMTKGWSRFVKEKHLDAGDTVLFGRGVGHTAGDRLFIDWKRRPDPHFKTPAFLRIPGFPSQHHSTTTPSFAPSTHHHPYLSFYRSSATPWAAGRLFIPNATPPQSDNHPYSRSATIAAPQKSPGSAARPAAPVVLDSVPVANGNPAGRVKSVRIFGVNLEQQLEAANHHETASLLRLQLRSPLTSPDLCLAGVEPSPSAFSPSSLPSSWGAKESQH